MTDKVKKAKQKILTDQEMAARKTLLEELFRDFHTNRFQVYKMNFIRGLAFGFGSVLGGTVVIALLIWILTLLSDTIPFLSDFFNAIQQLLQTARE